jgi:hypothetical protein
MFTGGVFTGGALPQLSEKNITISCGDVVQQWFYIFTWLFLISSPSPL